MSRSVPSALQTHLNLSATTTCRLIKITTKGGTVFGLTTLDRDIAYDDLTADGEIVYAATNAVSVSAFASESGPSVDNGEASVLVSSEIGGISVDMVDRGDFDDGQWVCYLVNYEDTTPGRHIELGSGDIGDVSAKHGMIWIPELLDTVVRLRQTIGTTYSRTCRAEYGRPATAENGFRGCGVDLESLWVSGEVTSVSAEPDMVFSGDAVPDLPRSPYPAVIEFLSGGNAGRSYAIETIEDDTFTLLEPTYAPVEVGDEYRARRDCGKLFIEDCVGVNANGLNFKGEPHIVDASEVAAPQ